VEQDQYMLNRARTLRKSMTPFEAKLWARLSRSQLAGYKFRRQHVIANCIVDFFCPQKALIVEVDGDTHDPGRDRIRDSANALRGYTTLRFANADICRNIEGVLQRLTETLSNLPDRWPHPNPSPEGEGKG
jgi:very-short-patch-repair endonuclease